MIDVVVIGITACVLYHSRAKKVRLAIQEAMEIQLKAERERREAILIAEGIDTEAEL